MSTTCHWPRCWRTATSSDLYSLASSVARAPCPVSSITVPSTQSAAPGPVVPWPIFTRDTPRRTAPGSPPGIRPTCSITARVPVPASRPAILGTRSTWDLSSERIPGPRPSPALLRAASTAPLTSASVSSMGTTMPGRTTSSSSGSTGSVSVSLISPPKVESPTLKKEEPVLISWPLSAVSEGSSAGWALDRDRRRVALARDRLDHLNADPGEVVVADQALGDALGGRLDELELALDDDGLDRLRGRRVVERVGEVVAGRGLGDVGGHVDREHQRLLGLPLPVVHPDDRGHPQIPDRYRVSHTFDASDHAPMRPRGPPAHIDWPRERRAGTAGSGREAPSGAGGRERAAARGPVDGDPRPRRREAARPRGAADRLGQVGRVLRRDRAAARGRSGPDRDRLAAAGADAEPGRGGSAGGNPCPHDQLRQPRGLAAGLRGGSRRRGRRAACQPRAPQQPRVPRQRAAPPDLGRGADRDRRGALHLRLGARLPARLPPDQNPARDPAGGHTGAGDHRDRQRPCHHRRR